MPIWQVYIYIISHHTNSQTAHKPKIISMKRTDSNELVRVLIFLYPLMKQNQEIKKLLEIEAKKYALDVRGDEGHMYMLFACVLDGIE